MALAAILSIAWYLVTIIMLVIGLMFFKSCHDKYLGLPPGPQWIPVMGTVAKLSQDFHRSIHRLSQYYGDVFAMYVADRRVVFINDLESAKETLITKSSEFGSRPSPKYDYLLHLKNKCIKRAGIASGELNDVWKTQRKFSHSVLRSFGLGKSSFQDQIMLHVDDLLKILGDEGCKPIELTDSVGNCVANVICSIMFNKKYDYGDAEFKGFVSAANEFFYISSLLRMTPYMFFRPLWDYASRNDKTALAVQSAIMSVRRFCENHITEHAATLDRENIRDFIDVYLLECEKERDAAGKGFDHEQLISILFDLFVAGIDTTASTLQWAVLFMVLEPEVQEKVYEEIISAIGDRDTVLWDDRAKLPYTAATIMEIQRLGNVAPFSLPHAASCDTSVGGYNVMKGDTVMVNLWAIHTDPRLWDDPMRFQPERFIDEDTGSTQKLGTFLPFSAGRRVCLGEQLAKMELLLFFSNIILNFKLLPVSGAAKPELDSTFGLTLQPKPYKFIAQPRGSRVT